MGLFDRFRTKSAGVPAAGSMPLLGSLASTAGVVINQTTAMSVSAVYACVSIRAEDGARCTPTLWRVNDDGSRDAAKGHPVQRLFRKPNRLQTWFEFYEQMQVALLLRGNAYAVILRDSRGNPAELIPCNPDAVQPLEASDGSLFYQISRVGLFQLAVLRDVPQRVPAEDVFHLRGMSFNATVGANRTGLARDSIGVTLGLEQQAARWMANGARPSFLLKSAKSLTKEAAERLKSTWERLFGGIQNVGATAVLEEGLEAQPLSISAVDLEFIAQRKLSIEDVTRWFRMPPHKIGVTDGLSKTNQAQADQDYVNNTIMPDLVRWEQKFVDCFDLDGDAYEVDFDEDELLRADVLTRLNVGRLGVLSGLLTPNEWRRREKLPPVKGGDEVRAPVNLAELGSDMTGTAPDGAGRPPKDEESPAKDKAADVASALEGLVKALPQPVVNVSLPPVNVTVDSIPVSVDLKMPPEAPSRTIVKKHDERGRILEFEKHPIESGAEG
jgi:HK97 family phage portal protein